MMNCKSVLEQYCEGENNKYKNWTSIGMARFLTHTLK